MRNVCYSLNWVFLFWFLFWRVSMITISLDLFKDLYLYHLSYYFKILTIAASFYLCDRAPPQY